MRPASVWITQILLWVFGLMYFVIWVFNTFRVAKREGLEILTVKFIIFTIITFSIISLFAVSFWGLMKRKIYGKWCALASVFIIWIILAISQFYQSARPIKPYQYSNTTQLVAGSITQVVIHLLFLILMFRLAFSKSVGSFFTPTSNN
ncbi:MAG: hypothetical protein HY819_17300 [Acidobacteria bacterium]|nr:hypothetical protein [Acidobacteriota bacterium]